MIEVLNFNKQNKLELDLAIFSNNIAYVTIDINNHDFSQKANDASRLQISFYTNSDFNCDHKASGHNCDNLVALYTKYIKPNIVGG